jgi:6-phosphogluconolactonase
MTPRLIRTRDFAAEAARWILDVILAAITQRGLCRVALSGGNTPGAIHQEMVRQGASDVRWERVQFTFGDERCVPPDAPDSNYRMARESLLDPLAVPAGNVFRIRGEIAPEVAAREYEEKLAAVAARFTELRYVHDLVILGMGPDGHTASLFPNHPALTETARNVIAITDSPKPPPERVTMTLPVLNAARQACFLVTGADKLPLVEEIVAGRSTLPAALVRPAAVTWITD